MSQVLIGIIGVILFIGLALAGALFLGPQFQESANNSKASASVQAVAQVAAAYNMHQVQEGNAAADPAELQTDGYLKTVPANPTGGGALAFNSGGTAVEMQLSGNAEAICQAINKQSNGVATIPTTAPTSGVNGCYETAASSDIFRAYAFF